MPCMAYLRLSSPCGDKLQSVNLDTLFATEALSSPCGDKLQFLHQIIKGVLKNVKCFRPLTGIICETAYHEVGHLFPPPYGDHIDAAEGVGHALLFPPPYGDHIFCGSSIFCCSEFPPPYGDHILNISQPIEKRKSQKVGKCLLYCNAVNLHKKEQMQTLRL